MRRPYRFSAAHARGRPAPSLAVVDLSGQWRANVADDERRRSAVGLDYPDDDWPEVAGPQPLAQPGAVRRQRRPPDLPQAVRARAAARPASATSSPSTASSTRPTCGSTARTSAIRRATSSRTASTSPACRASPPSTCWRSRWPARRSATARPSAPSPGCSRTGTRWIRRWNPGGLWRPVRIETTGPVRIDRWRVLCRDVNDTRAHLRLHARLDSDVARTVRLCTRVDGALLDQHEQSLAGGLNEVDWTLDINDPRLWWPWSLGDQDADRRRGRDIRRRGRSATRARCAPACARSCCRTGCSPSTASRCSSRAPTWRRPAWRWATPHRPSSGAMSSWPATPASTCCAFTATSRGPSCTTPPTSSACCCGRTSRCSGATPAPSARRPCARPARRSTSSAITRRSRCGAPTTNRSASNLDRAAPIGKAAIQYIAGQQLPSWNKTVLDRWVKRAFEQADETRTTIAHSGVLPHLPQLDGTDSHLYFGWYHGDERDLPGFAATMPRMVRFVSEFGAQAVPTAADFMEPKRWPDLDWERLAGTSRHAAARVRQVRAARMRTRPSTSGATRRSGTRRRCCAITSRRCAG